MALPSPAPLAAPLLLVCGRAERCAHPARAQHGATRLPESPTGCPFAWCRPWAWSVSALTFFFFSFFVFADIGWCFGKMANTSQGKPGALQLRPQGTGCSVPTGSLLPFPSPAPIAVAESNKSFTHKVFTATMHFVCQTIHVIAITFLSSGPTLSTSIKPTTRIPSGTEAAIDFKVFLR